MAKLSQLLFRGQPTRAGAHTPLSLALSSALLSLLTPLAFAQNNSTDDKQDQTEEETTLESVVVTGSKIKRTDYETSQPILSLTKADIQATGSTQIGDILQSLPEVGPALNQTFNNGGNGSTYVDLRSLGPNRTLVLVNGKRYAPDGTALSGVVDMNAIPTSIIERVEVLKDGASTIYGSDAIGGVINIITTDEFDGMSANGYIGRNSEGDGMAQSYDFTVGAKADRTSIVANVSFRKNEPIFAGDRDISAVPQFGADFCSSSTSPSGRFGLTGRAGTFTLTNGTATPPGVVQNANNIRPFAIPGDCYNFAPDNYLLTPQERYALFAKVKHEISDNINFRAEAVYNNRKSEQLLAPVPLTFAGNGLFGTNNVFDVSAQSYFNPFGVDTTRVQRRMSETGGRSFSQTVDVWHFSGGFDGYFDLLDRSINWDVGYTFSLNQQSDITKGQVNFNRVQAAVGPSFRDAQGVIRCGTPNNVIAGCIPLNLFGGNGSITREMLDYISVPLQDAFEYRRTGYQANISSELFELPAGPLAFAAGYEYRRESGFDLPDALTASGASSGNIRQPTGGGYRTNEFFAELAIPILSGVTGAESLEVSLATRYSDFDTFGNTSNSKIGFKWKPINDLIIRGSYSEGFRAPDISSLFLGNSDAFANINDPCTGPGQATADRFSTLSAAQQANCRNAGVPAGGAQQASGQIRTTIGGNPNLVPELSTSTTFGFVYNPEFLPGFDISIDRWRISIDDVIGTLGGQTILDACVLGGATAQCQLITRLPGTGAVTGLLNTNLNAGTVDIAGYDMGVGYAFETDNFGSFKTSLNTAYFSRYDTETPSGIPGDPLLQHFVGNYYGTSLFATRLKAQFVTSWSMGDWSANWTMRYSSRLKENCTRAVNPATQCTDPNGAPFNVDLLASNGLEIVPINILGGTTYHDLQLSWTTPWSGTIAGGVRNAFAKDPPVSIQAAANSFDPSYDIPGRFFYLNFSQKF